MRGQQFSRGEIYYIDFGDGMGSEQKGCRPAVIISNNIGNRNSTTIIVAAITSQRPDKANLPTHVHVGTETGLDKPSIILSEQIRTISKDRVSDYVGTLSEGQIKALWRALAISIGETDGDGNNIVMCLCKRCADNFRIMGKYKLLRVAKSHKRDTCTYCNYRKGYDYELIPKE